MPDRLAGLMISGAQNPAYLAPPLLLALWMAWGDIKSRRIPNYLTLFTALSGLGFHLGAHGWLGLAQGFLGLGVGLALMLPFYITGGMGAGDVKALAGLGAWLGPWATLLLFIYMGVAGLPLIIFYLFRRGELETRVRYWGVLLKNYLLSRGTVPSSSSPPALAPEGLPYAVAMALGMMLLCLRGL
ncbi:MAG: A24 family peptidase [Desulfobaccales bacterium]